jgi:hypothetical protein
MGLFDSIARLPAQDKTTIGSALLTLLASETGRASTSNEQMENPLPTAVSGRLSALVRRFGPRRRDHLLASPRFSGVRQACSIRGQICTRSDGMQQLGIKFDVVVCHPLG